ncbi:hypothetical protein ILYODFUR_026046 [Ilyodon furcidens]|uniref:Uncharacterized protein n=1 Tax=Ilyodon furcidens TaxID=33524 RepID=A0ABV0T0H1_9TELE
MAAILARSVLQALVSLYGFLLLIKKKRIIRKMVLYLQNVKILLTSNVQVSNNKIRTDKIFIIEKLDWILQHCTVLHYLDWIIFIRRSLVKVLSTTELQSSVDEFDRDVAQA